jgi:hypothetical protein
MGMSELVSSLFSITKHSLSIYDTRTSVIMLLWITALTSCASSLRQLPSLKNRALRIDSVTPKFYYQWEKCTGKLWWRKCVMKREYYDFTDPAVRKKLKDMGFKLKIVK